MKNRLRTLVALAFVLVVVAGGWFIYRASVKDNAQRTDAFAQGVATDSADAEVCSHVRSGDYLMAPGGDWNTPTVAAVASGASSLVRDAYFTAASVPFPKSANWSQTFPPFERAMSQLATVCAAVRARG